MGCFDEVYFPCLRCPGTASIQSKAGDCCMSSIPGDACPRVVAHDVIGEWADCDTCGKSFRIREPNKDLPPDTIRLELEP